MPKISQYSSTTPVSGDQFVLARAGSNYRTDFSSLNKVVQVAHAQTGAVATGTTVTPFDDTIPQNTEGDQYMTAVITPTNALNKLLIESLWIGSSNAAVAFVMALHQDSVANALAVVAVQPAGLAFITAIPLRHEMTAGTILATTFKIRVGGNIANTTTFNGLAGARYFGGVLASYIRITEFTP